MKNGMLGRHHSKETRKLIGLKSKGRYPSKEVRAKMSSQQKEQCSRNGEKERRISLAQRLWQDPRYVEKQKLARNIYPNKEEQRLNKLLQEILPNEYKYVGDFSFTIEGKCPDFLSISGKKRVIEYNGTYWHKDETEKEIRDRANLFKRYGYDTLIIWDYELKNEEALKSKILKFSK